MACFPLRKFWPVNAETEHTMPQDKKPLELRTWVVGPWPMNTYAFISRDHGAFFGDATWEMRSRRTANGHGLKSAVYYAQTRL